MPNPNSNLSVNDFLEVVFRHRMKVLLIPAVVIGLGLAIALFAPRTYRSEAKLSLQVGRQSVALDPTAQTGQQMISLQQLGREGEVTTAMELISSRGVIGKVVDRLGPDYILRGGPEGEGSAPNFMMGAVDTVVEATLGRLLETVASIDPIGDRERAIIEVEESLATDAERDSTLIDISYSTDTPRGAQAILDTLIDVYREEHLRINRNKDSRSFFQEQEGLIREQLSEAMNRVREAQDEIGVASIEARRQNLEAQLQTITMAAYQAETERNALLAELKEARRQAENTPERLEGARKSMPNEGADLLREQLYSLQVREADLKARYSESHPLVRAISQQIEEAEKVVDSQSSLREETFDDVNPIHRQLLLSIAQNQSKAASLEARLRALRDQDKTIRDDLEKINADGVRLAHLTREESILDRKYIRYSDNLEQTRIDEELEEQEISSVSVAQEPTLAEKPVSPSKLLVALGSMVFAVAATSATVLGLEQISDRLRSDKAIEQATSVPVLASIPESSIHGRVLTP